MISPALRQSGNTPIRCALPLAALLCLVACGGAPVADTPAPDEAAVVAPAAAPAPAATTDAPDVVAPAPETATTAPADGTKSGEIEFFDSSSFDDELSGALGPHPPKVEVIPLEHFGLNQVPPRLGKWLSKVKDSGGKVQAHAIVAEGATASRALFGLAADVVVAVYDHIHDSVLYGPVKQYDAVLWYRRETGMVERVTFTHRDKA